MVEPSQELIVEFSENINNQPGDGITQLEEADQTSDELAALQALYEQMLQEQL